MKVFLTGDTHGHIDVGKLSASEWKEQDDLCRDDLLVILGDFGFIWTAPDQVERYWLRWFDRKPFRVAFLDGNHENHDRLREFPAVDFHGGKAGQISANIWHLRRGEVYAFGDHTVFVMGGALSVDKALRRTGVTWWADEIPSEEDLDNARRNLSAAGWKVNSVLTHTLPRSVLERIGAEPDRFRDPTAELLDGLRERISFEHWYAGHFHVDVDVDPYRLLYVRILQI